MRTSFAEKVYKCTAQIPKGKVSTYRDIAHQLRCKAYRAVGQALHRNPFAPKIPCHRIISSDGSLGGFASGLAKKKQLLRQEGISIKNNTIDLKTFGYQWNTARKT